MVCEMCDGDEDAGPAIVRVRMRDWDNSVRTLNLCKGCQECNGENIVATLKRPPKENT